MKKRILLIAGLASAFFIQAQSIGLPCVDGYWENGIYDAFDSTNQVGNLEGGVYFWGEDALGGDANPNHQSKLTRSPNTSSLVIDFSQGQGEYLPFGASFGTKSNGAKSTIDLSSDAKFEITVTNTSDSAISVALAIEDSSGNALNTYNTANVNDFANAYQHAVVFNVDPGKTVTKVADFAGGYYANYTNNQLEQNCDLKLISGFTITVTNPNSTGAPNWAPLALPSITFALKDVKLGQCPKSMSLSNKNQIQFNAFPNPANDQLTINLKDQNVNPSTQIMISNLIGEKVLTTNVNQNNTVLDVSNLKSGMYIISIVDNQKVIGTNRIVVK